MKSIFILVAVALSQFAVAQKTVELKEFKNLIIGSDTKVTMVKANRNYLIINDDEGNDVQNEAGSLALGSDGNYVLYYNCDIQNITVSSDAVLTCDEEIKTKVLNITANSDAVVKMEVNVKQLNTVADSDAEVTLKGKAVSHSATFSSDAVLNAKNLITKISNIVFSSDAEGVITAKETVNARVSSDASITIYGNPDTVNKDINDAAEIIVK